MCGTARDIQGCIANLRQFKEEYVLKIQLLESVYDLPIASPTLEEEAALLSKPPEAQVTTTHPPGHEEWASNSESAAGLGEAMTEPQGMQRCPPQPGFESLPLEQDVSLIWVPNLGEAQSLLTQVGVMSVVIYRNEITGKLENEYEYQYLKPLHLELPNPRPKIIRLRAIK